MAQNPPDPDQPVAWRVVVPDSPVRSSDGQVVGTVSDVLGSNEEDIFHGIVVALAKPGDHEVLVLADDIDAITAGHIDVVWPATVLRSMPAYTPDHEFHVGMTGRFRKHPGWVEDKDR